MPENTQNNLFEKQSVAEQKAQEIIMDIDDVDSTQLDMDQIQRQSRRIKKTGNFLVDTMNYVNEKLQSISSIPLRVKVAYFQMLSVMINAGMPLTKSLNIIYEQEENKRFKNIIKTVLEKVEGGLSLSDAMIEHLGVFTEAEIGLVKSGEVSGQLNSILKQLAIQIEKNAAIKSKIKGAMIYPVLIFCIMFVAIAVVMILVVPPISALFLESGKELPAPTKVLITLSNFSVNYWQEVSIGLLIAVVLIGFYKRTPQGKYVWDKIMLMIPIFGPLRKKVIISQFARNLGNLLGSGISIIRALKIVADALGNEVYRKRIMLMSEDIKRGLKLADNLAESDDIFPPVVANMIAVGEQTAQLDSLTGKIADYYEEEVDNYVKNLMKMLEPIIMVTIGVVVGGMVAAIMLPIMDLTSLAGGTA